MDKKLRTVNINGKEIPVLLNNRALIEFERYTGKSSAKISTFEDTILMLHCSLKTGARSIGMKFDMDFDAFIDYTDEHPEVIEKPETVDVIAGEGNADDKKKATT